jgi:hypothetical protein
MGKSEPVKRDVPPYEWYHPEQGFSTSQGHRHEIPLPTEIAHESEKKRYTRFSG